MAIWFTAVWIFLAGAGALPSEEGAAPPPQDTVPKEEIARPDSSEALPLFVMPPMRTRARRIRPVPAVPGSRTVLTREWLERVDPTDLGRALAPVAGLRVVHLGDGMGQTVSLRGLGAERVAVMIDGRPVNSAQGGGVDLTPLDLEGIERVEILRGAMSALYGPDAMAGAVNLIRGTRRLSHGSLRFLGGTGERVSLRAAGGIHHERWRMDGALRAETASPRVIEAPAHNQAGGGYLRVTWHPGWAGSMEAGIEHRRDRRDVPGTRHFPSPGAQREDRITQTTAALTGAMLNGVPGAFTADVSHMEFQRTYDDAANPLGAVSDRHRNQRDRLNLSWKKVGERSEAGLRMEGVQDRLQSTTEGTVRRNRGAFAASGARAMGRWSATASIRSDALEGFSPRPTLRAGVSHTLWGEADGTHRGALRVGAGTGFRPPTFDDLFWPARASAAGNPNLLPERTRDAELFLEWVHGGARVSTGAHHARVRDLIQWTPGADGVWRPHNVGEARLFGVELEGRAGWRWMGVDLWADVAASWLDAIDATDDPLIRGKQLVGRARETGYLELSGAWRRWTLAGGVRAVSRTPLTAVNSKWAPGYAVVHGRVRLRAARTLRLDVEVRNALDRPVEDLRGYAAPGRELLVGFRFNPLPGETHVPTP